MSTADDRATRGSRPSSELLGDAKRARCSSTAARASRRSRCTCPGPDFVDRVHAAIRPARPRCCAACSRSLDHGRLAGTGYLSILPVDQGIEHSAGASFAPNPAYFDPENIVKLAIEGGCNAVASTLGVLGSVARKYAHKIPFIVKINHNEFLTYPNKFDQIMFAQRRSRPSTWARWPSARRSTSARRSRRGRSSEVSAGLPAGARAGHGHRALVLPAQPRLQDQGEGLPRLGRPDRPGQSPGRDDRGRHHQAEAAREQRRLQRAVTKENVRQDRQARLRRADHRPPDRPGRATRWPTATWAAPA